ncbi:flagellar basal body P-ring formation chaperone FlgA [Aliidiomarina quisquiliarum]|uniref:flagellar basal body P-ring formation chaperone FlgA n=1 Tax=Aliidiomarina quisquiliarum TaxID=2938947 RepID=UPI00208F4726|nr:flagellar basal body P-ring formation chaperone FlgA [Aliidiomarina quisquiliarum]MCO4321637.1 flagellar basal body P-ring formation protein FlgA [Aliidiomarina quisquiliarum]
MKYAIILLSIVAVFSAPAYSVTYTHAELAVQAEQFLQQQLTHLDGNTNTKAHTLDSRMPERSCLSPLDITLAGNHIPDRQATVQVECLDPNNTWRLFIPVRIQQVQTVVVAAHNLSAGQVISASDLQVTEVDVQQVRDSVFTNPEQLIGAKIKRRVGSQQPIQARHTCFVCRGESVTIVSVLGNLHLQATGLARSDGLLGERIVVKNKSSNKDIQGVVTAMGEVTIGY